MITFEYYPANGKLYYARAHGRTWDTSLSFKFCQSKTTTPPPPACLR
jgi:hypothetical protein